MIEVSAHSGMAEIAAETWDLCTHSSGGRPEDPFTTYRFLAALENSGSTGPDTGWQPHPLVARKDGEVIGVAPLFVKTHSQGEYIFDHNWAHAYEGAGGAYYPKLQIAVPFTPVTGPRLLARAGHEDDARAALIQGAVRLAKNNGLSGVHITFCNADEAAAGATQGLLPRLSQQYHWENNSYADFDAFLAALSSRKRKAIRKERRVAQGFGGEIVQLTGEALRPEHWDAMWRFYQDTGARKWGTPYLTRAFFDLLHQEMRDDVLLVLAIEDGTAIAGALNFIGARRLFGRYWGSLVHRPCLHFELCYYQAIDYAITHGLETVEAGAQGDHKLSRGYLPVACHSLHWLRDPGFAEAVGRYLAAERDAIGEDITLLTEYGPFRSDLRDDHD